MDTLLPSILSIWRSPEFRSVTQVFVWLCSINAGFWILARIMGAFADVLSELFWEDLWSAVAVVYNIVLAVFFSAIIFVSATKGAPPKDFLWREGCGFILLYIALGASYMEADTHEIDQHARAGYGLGLIGYIVFAAFPKLVAEPRLYDLIKLMKVLADSWIGKALTVLMVLGLIYNLARRGLHEMFYHLSPFLWFVGALKHPPIRVRRK